MLLHPEMTKVEWPLGFKLVSRFFDFFSLLLLVLYMFSYHSFVHANCVGVDCPNRAFVLIYGIYLFCYSLAVLWTQLSFGVTIYCSDGKAT
jgi:hypothetical protein